MAKSRFLNIFLHTFVLYFAVFPLYGFSVFFTSVGRWLVFGIWVCKFRDSSDFFVQFSCVCLIGRFDLVSLSLWAKLGYRVSTFKPGEIGECQLVGRLKHLFLYRVLLIAIILCNTSIQFLCWFTAAPGRTRSLWTALKVNSSHKVQLSVLCF